MKPRPPFCTTIPPSAPLCTHHPPITPTYTPLPSPNTHLHPYVVRCDLEEARPLATVVQIQGNLRLGRYPIRPGDAGRHGRAVATPALLCTQRVGVGGSGSWRASPPRLPRAASSLQPQTLNPNPKS